jgi:hypothetical protein
VIGTVKAISGKVGRDLQLTGLNLKEWNGQGDTANGL